MNSSTQEPIVVACAADNFFSMPLAVTAFSAFKNLDPKRQLILFILDGGISSANKKKLLQTLGSKRVDVRWITPTEDEIKTKLLTCKVSNYPISAYYRLLLPTIIPQQFEKVIYLDSDVVVEGDLAKLWDQDLKDQALLAVQDPTHKHVSEVKHLKNQNLEEWGVTLDHKYFNSGVLVINLEKWRQDHIADRVLEFIGQHPDLPLPDQDALNIVLAGQWDELDPRWNQTHVVHTFKSSQDSPYDEGFHQDLIHHPFIIHYTSRPKPWGKNCTHPQADRYFHYLDQTAWSGWRNNVITHNTALARRGVRRIRTTALKLSNRLLPAKFST